MPTTYRWLVVYYDGNYNRAAYVTAHHDAMPFGAEGALEAVLGIDHGGVTAIVGPLPDGWDGSVVIGDEEAAVRELELGT